MARLFTIFVACIVLLATTIPVRAERQALHMLKERIPGPDDGAQTLKDSVFLAGKLA